MSADRVSSAPRGPAYRIETDRLTLRCWAPEDAPVLRRILDRSDAHLRPFIPFMRHEPRTLDETTQWLRTIRADFDLDRHHRYAIEDRATEQIVGEVMLLHVARPQVREIGYWIDVDQRRRGYTHEACAALLRVAFAIHAVDRVELHCEPDNVGSRAVATTLGFTHEATLRRRVWDGDGPPRDVMYWVCFREVGAGDLGGLRATDCRGIPIPSEG